MSSLAPAYGQGSVTHLWYPVPLAGGTVFVGSLVFQALGLCCRRTQLQWKATHPGTVPVRARTRTQGLCVQDRVVPAASEMKELRLVQRRRDCVE